jgi:hypothetical protein
MKKLPKTISRLALTAAVASAALLTGCAALDKVLVPDYSVSASEDIDVTGKPMYMSGAYETGILDGSDVPPNLDFIESFNNFSANHPEIDQKILQIVGTTKF